MANGAEPSLTIDQLAQRTGMTVRNIRAHQSRGLLDPPEVRGRTGYYGRAHVERLELIRRLQADGYSLDLIGRMLVTAGDQSAEALRFTEALRQPWADEQPRVVKARELADRYGTDDPELLAKAEELGLVRPLGDGHWEEMSPRLGRAGAELTDLGIPRQGGAAAGGAGAPQRRQRRAHLRRTCSWRRCGSRSSATAAPRSAGPRSWTRWSACARWPRTR